jgi:hypothetical protein
MYSARFIGGVSICPFFGSRTPRGPKRAWALCLRGVDRAGADFLREVVVGPPLQRGPALHGAGDDHRALREEEALLELLAARAVHPRDLERAFDVVEHEGSSLSVAPDYKSLISRYPIV